MTSRSDDAKTPLCRFAFTDGLFKAFANDTGVKSWTCTLLFPKSTDIGPLRGLAVDACSLEWGDKAMQMIKDGLIHNPFLDGDGPQGKSKKSGEPHNGFPGTTFLRVKSGEDYRPRLFDRHLLPITDKDGALYSGAYGFAVVSAFTWENKEKGKGVSFGISMLQVTKDGDRLGGGGAAPEEYFEKIADEGDAPTSTKSGAGAAGLFG